MAKFVLNKGERMLFALLRGSLHNVDVVHELFISASAAEWKLCYDTAARQGVLALAWDGLSTLPKELHPPKQIKFQWGLSVDKYEAKHRQYCKTVQELQQFYREHGIVAVQMKGVGFSANYSKPEHREGGDIDIFTYSADTSKMSHKEANLLADKLMEQMGEEVDTHSYKHSNLVPSSGFNTIFISCHAFQHYGSGISLHHLYDWAVLLKNSGLKLPGEVKNENFLRAIAAFTHLSNVCLGTDISLEGYPAGYSKLADEMLEEIFKPVYTKIVPYTNKVQILVYKTRKVFRSAKLANDVFGASFMGRLWESVIAHVKDPSTIFSRGEK